MMLREGHERKRLPVRLSTWMCSLVSATDRGCWRWDNETSAVQSCPKHFEDGVLLVAPAAPISGEARNPILLEHSGTARCFGAKFPIGIGMPPEDPPQGIVKPPTMPGTQSIEQLTGLIE